MLTYTYHTEHKVSLNFKVARHAAYDMAAQAVGMQNFDKQPQDRMSFEDGQEPWRWSTEQTQQDHCRRMGTLAALKAGDDFGPHESNDAIGTLFGCDQSARSRMASILNCPSGTDFEFWQAGRHVEKWWQTIACLAELLYLKGRVGPNVAAGMMQAAMWGGPHELRTEDPSSYEIGDSWVGLREEAA